MNPVKLFLFIIAIPIAYHGYKSLKTKKAYGIITLVIAGILFAMALGLFSIFRDYEITGY